MVPPQAVSPTAAWQFSQYANGDGAARDKRIRDLEQKIRVLMKELAELRGDVTMAMAAPTGSEA